MDPVQSLGGVTGSTRVQERAGGGSKRQADAFRRALADETADEDTRQAGGEPPLRTKLQPRRPADRNNDGAGARHVDVIA